MKTLICSSIFVFGLNLISTSSVALPSSLANCSANGWSLKRIGVKEALQFITTNGTCAAKFSIVPTHDQISDGWRAEIQDPLHFPHETLATYEFSTYLPAQLKGSDTPNLVLAQWHDNKVPGTPAQRPPFSLRLRSGHIVLPLFNQQVVDRHGLDGKGQILFSQSAQFEKWTRWRIRAFWSPTAKGSLEVWMNGKRIVRYRGPIGYAHDITAPYFKLGIYTTEPFNKPLWVYHTDYRRTFAIVNSYGKIQTRDR
ncbi:polysaccharide lyase [Bdellovibrio bacteriovorus]|uniref:polysaccharide lyase n=1 Tax=Bdellovibrio bacteriovorus TaxID=959 RepID=UPI0035A90C6A